MTRGRDPKDQDLLQRITGHVLAHGGKQTGDEVRFRCPTPDHPDEHPSASWNTEKGVWQCFSCGAAGGASGLARLLRLPPPERRRAQRDGREPVATYDYTDAGGRLLFQVVRYEPKQFRQRRPNASGGWVWNLGGVQPVLYRLPEVLDAARRGATVYIAEGEKDVEALRAAGATATCNPGGAGKWRDGYAEALRGAHVVVVQDADDPGRRHAAQVAASLRGLAASVRLVVARQGKDAADHVAAGYGLTDFVDVALPPCPDGATLLADVEAFIRRYVSLPNEPAYVATTLWVAHTHALDCFESTPRLAFLSPEPACGKTRALEVLELLVPRPMLAVTATPAALFRAVAEQEERPTILFDEIDTIFGPKAKHNEELRGLLNAGHRRSGVAYRCVGEGTRQEARAFPAFAAVALAGIGDLPDTLRSRSIVIAMRRRAPDEQVEPFRRREAQPEGERLCARLAAWAAGHLQALAAVPTMPADVTDRAADMWEPLLAVADAAGADWPARAHKAAVELLAAQADQESSVGVRLLADIRAIFEREAADALPTAVLLERLHTTPEAPWQGLGPGGKPIDAYWLARRLGGYGVRSKNLRVREGGAVVKGYERAAFAEPWSRYLTATHVPPPESRYSRYTATSGTNPAAPVAAVAAWPEREDTWGEV